MADGNFKISHEYELASPRSEKAYMVSFSEWHFIRNKVTCIKSKVDWFATFGSIFAGAVASTIITIFATDFKNPSAKTIFWLGAGACFLVSIVCYIASATRSVDSNAKPTEIIDQMDLIEQRYVSTQQP